MTRDIPDWSIVAGNPCRVIRMITEEDRRKLFRNEEIDDEAWADILLKQREISESKQKINASGKE